MKLSKRSFSKKFNFEVQWLSNLCNIGIIPHEIIKGNRPIFLIDEEVINLLEKDNHFVECPHCKKKMACITEQHSKICKSGLIHQYSQIYLQNHKKTDSQKKNQSEILKKRFQTPDGEITRNQIGIASKKLNADPEFKAKKSLKSFEVQNRPESKNIRSKASKKMWSDPVFREKMAKQIGENIDKLRDSAKRARQYSKKTSNLHIGYKTSMLKKGLQNFISEYPCGPYFIDEADPFTKIALEVDGCYWHGCLTCGHKGDSRIQLTDKRKATYLKNRGWIIIRIKEHEIKKDPYVAIEMIRNVQEKRQVTFKNILRSSFLNNTLKVRSMVNKNESPAWVPIQDVLRHHTPHKRMVEVKTELGSVKVTEDHSLFDGISKDPIETSKIKAGDTIVGIPGDSFEPIKVLDVNSIESEKFTYDLSVPQAENFVLDSGILAHNSYSISGVSLDIEKSSKYMSIKDEFINEYDKLVEAAKRSIKIIKGLRQFRYGVGITSALGPLSRPGIQSRRNMVEAGSVGTWS
jgi:very-short-patch-repair endonuclease